MEDPDEYASPIPGGGSQYLFRRKDTRGPDGRSATLLRALGTGSFATTMDCWREVGGERVPVAIKQISLDKRSAQLAQDGETRGLEALSGALAGRAPHPNIVRFLGLFKGDEGGGRLRVSLVFERAPSASGFWVAAERNALGVYVPSEGAEQPPHDGCDLANNPHRKAPYALPEALHITQQILSAVAYLHTCGVVHRDIKPENVLLWQWEADGLPTVRITDYGTMRRLEGGDMTVGQGTRAFLAPEVDEATGTSRRTLGRPTASYDTSVDVFSVGATLYWMVTGESPSGNTRKPWEQRMGGDAFVSRDKARAYYLANKALWRKAQAAADAAAADAAAAATAAATAIAATAGAAASSAAALRSAAAAVGAAAPAAASPVEDDGDDIWGSSKTLGSVSSAPSKSADAAKRGAAAAPLPPVTVLECHFPSGSPLRVLLEGLVHFAPLDVTGAPPRRFTANEALAFAGQVARGVTAAAAAASDSAAPASKLPPSGTSRHAAAP